MRIVAISVGVLIAIVLLAVVVGYLLPVAHTATSERTFAAPPSRVFAAIATPAEYAQWRSGVKRVELLPPASGRTRFRETSSDGEITYVVDSIVPDRRMVTRIEDTGLPFGGSWTYDIAPAPQGTTLRITEDGKVYNPVFRFVSRFVMGHTRTIDRYLDDLERRLKS